MTTAALCSVCQHVHGEDGGPETECGKRMDASLIGLVRHWCECHEPQAEDIDVDEYGNRLSECCGKPVDPDLRRCPQCRERA